MDKRKIQLLIIAPIIAYLVANGLGWLFEQVISDNVVADIFVSLFRVLGLLVFPIIILRHFGEIEHTKKYALSSIVYLVLYLVTFYVSDILPIYFTYTNAWNMPKVILIFVLVICEYLRYVFAVMVAWKLKEQNVKVYILILVVFSFAFGFIASAILPELSEPMDTAFSFIFNVVVFVCVKVSLLYLGFKKLGKI